MNHSQTQKAIQISGELQFNLNYYGDLKIAQLGQIWYHFKARIKLLIEIEFFLAIGLKAAQYRDENTEF